VRDALIARGERAVVIDDPLIAESALPSVVRALDLAGVIAISSRSLDRAMIEEIEGIAQGAVHTDSGSDEDAILQAIAVAR
jgi:bifunctional enzyme CysN/CysC/sulfate adenylyltransferase subunit 1